MARTRGSRTHVRSAAGAHKGVQRMWQSARIFRRFGVRDIAQTSEVSMDHAKKYVRRLWEAGYLRIDLPGVPGQAGSHTVYALVRDTGPRAPIPSRPQPGGVGDRRVWDPNRSCYYGGAVPAIETKEARPEVIAHEPA